MEEEIEKAIAEFDVKQKIKDEEEAIA